MRKAGLFMIGGGLVIWYLATRKPAAGAVPIETQLASIWSVFVDAWVYREGVWLVYQKVGPFKEFTSINPGETVWIEVSENATLVYGTLTVALVPGGNWPVVWPT